MSGLHKEIFTEEQNKLLPIAAEFSDNFGLVGGTAVALHLGHRRSMDFDLFSKEKFGNQAILNRLLAFGKPDTIIVNKGGELTFTMKGVKFTFFQYPYDIKCPVSLGYQIKIPDLLTLAAMEAFALGELAKWKDYVDLYFIIKDHFTVSQISQKGKEIFGGGFNEKLFRSQLSYFDGMNYDELVEFLPGFEVAEKVIKEKLTEFSVA